MHQDCEDKKHTTLVNAYEARSRLQDATNLLIRLSLEGGLSGDPLEWVEECLRHVEVADASLASEANRYVDEEVPDYW